MDRPRIIKGQDQYSDERGKIENYYFDNAPINWIGLITSNGRGIVRANHYHPEQTQKCMVTKGAYISVFKKLPDGEVRSHVVREGDLEIMPPNWAHAMVFLGDTTFLNLVTGERKKENFGKHTIKHEVVSEKDVQKYLDEHDEQYHT